MGKTCTMERTLPSFEARLESHALGFEAEFLLLSCTAAGLRQTLAWTGQVPCRCRPISTLLPRRRQILHSCENFLNSHVDCYLDLPSSSASNKRVAGVLVSFQAAGRTETTLTFFLFFFFFFLGDGVDCPDREPLPSWRASCPRG